MKKNYLVDGEDFALWAMDFLYYTMVIGIQWLFLTLSVSLLIQSWGNASFSLMCFALFVAAARFRLKEVRKIYGREKEKDKCTE